MTEGGSIGYTAAVQDFRRARYQASLEQIIARLRGRPADLLSYEEVRRKLRAMEGASTQLKDIPLDAIVGSVGRYADFTRGFLPKQDSDQDRWARVMQAATSLEGFPPIEVYQVGDAYFVRDGNHRVSVTRQLGGTHIQAYVTKVQTRVPLSPDVDPDDLIISAEYADFLEATGLHRLRPEANLSTTVPGQYRALEEHIAVHRHFMGLEQQRETPYEEAALHWYDHAYLPVVRVIRQRGVLRDFSRTEADLYVWLSQHRAELEQELGWEIEPVAAAADLVTPPDSLVGKVFDAIVPDELDNGPAPGEWRSGYLRARQDDRLFAAVLVPISGEEIGWQALQQALSVALREASHVLGLHVLPAEKQKESEQARTLRTEFERRCQEAGVRGKVAFSMGKVPRQICRRARWADLVVLNLAHAPPPQPLAKLGSGLRTVLWNCPRPVLAVPGSTTPLGSALLAYDGSRKAEEALFVATYLASRWQIPLVVVTVVEEDQVTSATLTHAQDYLDKHGAKAVYSQETGPAAEAILRVAEQQQSELIIIGGYGHSPIVEVILGSVVNQVLRESHRPVLICR